MTKSTIREQEVAKILSVVSNLLQKNNLAIATDIRCKIFVVDKLTGEETELITDIGTIKGGD